MATATALPQVSSFESGDYYPGSLRKQYQLHGETADLPTISQTSAAKIDWQPNFDEYLARSSARLKAGNLEQSPPDGWPAHIQRPSAWTGSQFQDESSYTYILDASQIAEIEAAVASFKELNLPLKNVNKSTFPLPTLQNVLLNLCQDLHHGKGFCVLRGLNPKKYTPEDAAILFLGVSAYFGEQRGRQTSEGNVLTHILDATRSDVPPEKRAVLFTNYDQPFHADVICGIVGLQVFGCAAKGGDSILAPSHTVYNELAATRPDLIHVLSQNFVLDTFGRRPAYHKRPLLFHHDGNVILNFSRRNLTGSYHTPRTKGLPVLTEAQAEALDAVHFLAEKHQLKMAMAPGDLRFFNNLAILHRRDGFEDSENNKRHMMRVWLWNDELTWSLPPALQLATDRCFAEHDDLGEKDYSYQLRDLVKVPTLKTKMTCS